MAQASNVQREPSMEEILASIRRIIEDSDTVRKDPDDAVMRDDAENARLDNAVIEVDAFRAELRAARTALQDDGTLSLAEVQARMAAETRFEPERAGADFEVEPQAATVTETTAETPVMALPEWSVAQNVEPEPEPAGPIAAADAGYDDELAAALEELPVEYSADPEPVREDTVVATVATEVVKPAIISEYAGRQVAAAFGELSEAFAARSRKTFDDMAEEMMRPMLQDWLDNNLPTLVERLVREEIERVARGG